MCSAPEPSGQWAGCGKALRELGANEEEATVGVPGLALQTNICVVCYN